MKYKCPQCKGTDTIEVKKDHVESILECRICHCQFTPDDQGRIVLKGSKYTASLRNYKTLAHFLEKGKPWAILETTHPGVFVLKVPKTIHMPARLMVELRLVNNVFERKKRKAIILADQNVRKEFVDLLQDPAVDKLFLQLLEVNPPPKKKELIDILKTEK